MEKYALSKQYTAVTPKYFISIEIEISAIVLLAATDNPREVKKSLNSSLCIFFSL